MMRSDLRNVRKYDHIFKCIRRPPTGYACWSMFELVTYALDGGDAINAQFLTHFADMYVDGAVAHDDIRPPYLAEDFIA